MSFGRRLFVGIPEISPVGSAVSTASTRSALFPGPRGIKGRAEEPGVLYTVHYSFLAKTMSGVGLKWTDEIPNDEDACLQSDTGPKDMYMGEGIARCCLIGMFD